MGSEVNGTAAFVSKVAAVGITALAVAFGYGNLYSTVMRMEARVDQMMAQTIGTTAKLAELGAKIDVLQSQRRRDDREYPWGREER